jgi:hypothetical protein
MLFMDQAERYCKLTAPKEDLQKGIEQANLWIFSLIDIQGEGIHEQRNQRIQPQGRTPPFKVDEDPP